MAVDVSRTQDVYKDAGQSVNFTTLLLIVKIVMQS